MPLAPLPPYALKTPVFPFKHLVALAGRAPIGGAREVALACFVAARLLADQATASGDDVESRTSRCAGAKAWLGTLALPAPVKTGVTRCADATIEGNREQLARELETLTKAATTYLDTGSRHELESLAAALAA